MGLTASTQRTVDNYKIDENPNDTQIRDNIMRLFNENSTHNLSAVSASLKDINNFTDNISTGGLNNVVFNPVQKRYLDHNIQDYLNNLQLNGLDNLSGGKNTNSENYYQTISETSEFNKIRGYLLKDINGQSGGNSRKHMTLASTLLDMIPNESNLEDFDDSDVSDEFIDDELDDEELNDEELDDEELDDDLDIGNETSDNFIVNSASPSGGKYSDTSYDNNASSELNILPFYSTDSSINKHPYVASRFN